MLERLLINTTRIIMYIVVILLPVVGFIGGGFAGAGQVDTGALNSTVISWGTIGGFNLIGAVLGGLAGFLAAVLLFGMMAILLQIEANTRKS